MSSGAIADIRTAIVGGDLALAELLARDALPRLESTVEQVTVLLLWTHVARKRERRTTASAGTEASCLELALRAVELARRELPANDAIRASAEYRAAVCLHGGGRSRDAWEAASAAYAFYREAEHADSMLLSLYVELGLGTGHASEVLDAAQLYVEQQRKKAPEASPVHSMWLYGQCLAACGARVEGLRELKQMFDIAVMEGTQDSVLAEFERAIKNIEHSNK